MLPPATATPRQRAINVPAPLLLWIAILVAIQAGRSLLSSEADLRLLLDAAFLPAPWSIALGRTSAEAVLLAAGADAAGQDSARAALARYVVEMPPRPWSLVSYSVLHGSWTHLGVNGLLLFVFGSSVVARLGAVSALALWLAAAIGGAAAQALWDPTGVDMMIGASASVSGFMVAAAILLFRQPGGGRWSFLRERGALVLIGLWTALAFVAAPVGLADPDVAWAAHIGGLLVGLLVYPFLDPGRREPIRHMAS